MPEVPGHPWGAAHVLGGSALNMRVASVGSVVVRAPVKTWVHSAIDVAVAVGGVPVTVAVGVAISSGSPVEVAVAVGVLVGISVSVAVAVFVAVGVVVAVAVPVAIAVLVAVAAPEAQISPLILMLYDGHVVPSSNMYTTTLNV